MSEAPKAPILRMENVTKCFGDRRILDAVNLDIYPGETLFIVGPSGVGKSVSLKHMIRLLTPDEGRIWVKDCVINEATGESLRATRDLFGVLFQSGALIEWLTVFGNVALPLREKTDMSEDAIRERATEKLRLVGMEEHAHKHPSEISGGMRKRVALARAIVQEPEIILYDEPTSGLDPVSARTIDDLIAGMGRDLGVTSVVVTHDLHSALGVGSRIAMIMGGQFIEVADPDAFIRSKDPRVQEFLESQYITRRGAWEKDGVVA